MRTLIFDTETTGIVNFKSKKHDDQPHPVQLACELIDEEKTVGLFSVIINPDVPIPDNATAIHGITNEMTELYGLSQRAATGLFINFLIRCDRIVGHNIDFDIVITEAMIYRTGVDFDLDRYRKIPRVCTMKSTTDVCKLPGKYGHKWPQLNEAYRYLVSPEGMKDAHDALADVKACKAILFALEKQGLKLVGGAK